ncbi:NAD(P)-dependent alcohol dehydrogenase [Corynebacterium sp. 11A]|uniref:NAD(P)-dependent alcohol dehydrogenase n=1 Tax=Corynebacterium sp. 11A TaxID=2080510 RepID=UPI00124F10EA|nr:NAD(P)-dependent alcohol dehydrogenase [Corynebacterium sp. 11A]
MTFRVKAVQKTAPDSPFEIAEITRRDPRPDDVVIDIKAAGICHSDIHTIRNEWGEAHFPLTVGHEIAGVVSQVGSEVTEFALGERVGVGCMVNSCGECEQCRNHQEQDCLHGAVGTYNAQDVDGSITQGGYSQKVVVNKNFVCRIPDSIDDDHAAPLLCAGITTYAPIDRWGVKEGDTVAVLGLGGLGHMAVQIAAAKGARVTVLSRSMRKQEQARELGAERTLATTEEGFFEQHRGEFDFILNTISADIDVNAYLGLLKPHGVMVVVGLPPNQQPLHFGSIVGGAKVLAGSNIGGIKQTQEMLDFCAEHGISARIEKVSVHEVDEAYERVVNGEVQFRCVIDTASFDQA